MDKIEDKIQYETSHFNKNINEYKSQNDNLNLELNRLNNQYLKLGGYLNCRIFVGVHFGL